MAILERRQLDPPPDGREVLFLLSWAQRAGEALHGELGEGGLLTPGAARRCLVGLLGRLMELCSDVFEAAKNAYMAEAEPLLALDPKLATLEQRAAASGRLLSELEATGGECVFARAPLLRGLLERETERFVRAGRELFARLGRDRGDISRSLLGTEDFGLVTRISTGAGDLHLHGRSTSVIETQRGRFVYKPRDCGIDRELRELVGRVMPDCLGIPKCLVREGYGWCEYIEPGEVSSAAEVGRFYRRFGSACALMQALGGSDLHSSNWICSGGLPVLVDVETALSPVPRVFSDKRMFPELMSESESFLHDANRSLIPSSLLPSRLAGRELSVLLDDSGSSVCEPVLGGKRRSVLGFEAEFLSGFSEGYDRCLARRDELLRSLEGFSGVTVRRLLRDTSSYAKLLSRLHSPRALSSEESRSGAVRRLGNFFREHGAEHMLPIAGWEAECLLEGDIPYFSCKGGSHALLGGDRVLVEDFFSLSPVENARERIGRLSETEKRFELGLLSQSLSRALIPAEPGPEARAELADFAPLGREAALAEAAELFDRIDGLLLTGPSGKPSWLTVSERNMSLVAARPIFMQGTSGMGAFFAALCASGGARAARAAELAGICLEQLEAAAEQLESAVCIPEAALPLGISDGFGGTLRALDIMERCLGTGRAGALTQRLLALLEKAEIEDAQRLDVYSGAAGLLLALCPAYEHTGAEAALVHMRRAAERLLRAQTLEYRGLLLWDTLGKKRPISGAGHGMAGIAAALSWAGKLLGDARCLEAAAAALEFEHGIYSERLGTWPDLRASPVASSAMHGLCSGSPGIGLALLRCRESGLGSPGLEEDLARARHSCLTTGPLRRDHLCCGNSSAVEFLLTLPGCREQAGRLLAFMKARKDGSGGYRYMPENFRKVLCPDLFFGAAGIGFELLRYARPDLLTPVLF